MIDKVGQCHTWYVAGRTPTRPSAEKICESRDIFQARLDTMYRTYFSSGIDEAESGLLTAVAGEIGNNCFDHNLGKWRDMAGCWFEYGHSTTEIWIVLADRGQGIFSSLKRVVTTLNDDQEALDTAFQKRVSGRSPEKRGNGLKFVRSVINGHDKRGLLFLSGTGKGFFGGMTSRLDEIMASLTKEPEKGRGTFALILWKK